MRPELLAGGLFVAFLGVVFYVFPLPLVFAWSFPLMAGGGLMCVASLFMSESPGPVKPPEGFRFCVYCSNEVPIASERCPNCNGVQPKDGK